ncbi:hypothetical protein COLO4_20367 [Corchorus olitorius]|uniref:Uncharacterized protein n=1 Tax=Corchorus olitorius TaxID=93759 RepID=A0A1R3J054_9ROSI|nr:hypothetical protein COLO4_20367 [Corchorus olitorius]
MIIFVPLPYFFRNHHENASKAPSKILIIPAKELEQVIAKRGPQMRELEKEAMRIAREIEGEDAHDFSLAEALGSLATWAVLTWATVNFEIKFSSVLVPCFCFYARKTGRAMAIWRTTSQIPLLSFLLLTKSFFLEAAESHSSSGNIGSCIENERKTLLEFKTSLNDPSGFLSSWVGEECCNWTFVSCSNKTGNVLKLDLSWFNLCRLVPLNGSCGELGGTLNPSLLNLTCLSYLDLSGNNFSGPIPEFIGSLNNLRHLDLSRTSFNGKVPPSIGNLSNLEYLDLSHFELWASDLNWLSGLSSLKYLGLDNMNLSTAGTNWLQAVNMFPSLIELHMSSCELNSFPESLAHVNFSSLQVLDLSYNNFNSSIPPWLFNISTLTQINFNHCELKGSIPKTSRRNLCNLQKLDLSFNAIDGEINEFIEALVGCSNKTLGHIDLGSNNLKGNLPESLGSLKHLCYLGLTRNSLSGSLPMSIGNLSSLNTLDLSFNSMNGTIPESIGQLTSLNFLELFGNSWEGIITENYFRNLSSLFYFTLSSTSKSMILKLSQDWIPSFSLDELGLSHCQLGHAFPSWLRTQTDLSQLTLSSAGISDAIPDWFWSLSSQLWWVDLSDNQLRGKLPKSVSFNGASVWMDLGLIPKQLQGLQSLMILDLSKNNLSGGVPSSLCSLRALLFLNLNGNNLSGKLSTTLQNCSGLYSIDLGENQFSGTITDLVSYNMFFLGLRANLLTGSIPEELCKFPSLHIIDLAKNNLSGAIPKCLGNLTAFTYSGSYSSELPLIRHISFLQHVEIVTKGRKKEYTKIISLVKAIDLSSNNLAGEIPDHLTNLSALGTLNLSWNHLTGQIPENIGDLKRLETLDVSHNNLSGPIPPTMSSMTLLNYLNFSFNNLSGPIPSSNQFQTFNDPSIYQGNSKLCGPPLLTSCSSRNAQDKKGESEGDHEDRHDKLWFYVSMGLGFIVGFWVVCGSLVIKQSWRRAYFKFVDEMKDRIFVIFAVYCSRKKVVQGQ